MRTTHRHILRLLYQLYFITDGLSVQTVIVAHVGNHESRLSGSE